MVKVVRLGRSRPSPGSCWGCPVGWLCRRSGWRRVKRTAKGSPVAGARAREGQPALLLVASEQPSGEPGSPFPIALRGSGLGLGEAAGASPILRSNKHKYTEIIHGSGDLSRCLVSIC